MATVLQQQLAVIAANSTHQLDLKAQKARHSKSLLFQPRDAATQNFDTIYQLCLEGFEELCQLDSRFVPFSRNLFSEQSKNEDRTQMTAKEAEELDKVIKTFLGLLGGRLLLKPAMKAAEWLVRRFRVHEYNTETVLLTFLPYHSSHIFPTLLSILPEQLPSNFRFLHPYVSSLQSPPRHAVVLAASNNAAFFTAFSHNVLDVAKARHQSALLLGFWASVTAQAVNGMIDLTRSARDTIRRQKEEDLLLKVLPILQTALTITGVPELYLGSCMIMTILATKSSLSDKALDAMMEAVASGWTVQTAEDGITTLAVLAEEKQDLVLSRSVTRALLKQGNAFSEFRRIGARCRVDRLITCAAIGSVHYIVTKQDANAAQLLNDALGTDLTADDSKVELLVAAIKALSESEEDTAGRENLLRPLRAFAESAQNGSSLMIAASRKADTNLALLDSSLALQIQQGGDGEEDEDSTEQMLIEDAPVDEARASAVDLESLSKLPSKQISFLDAKHRDLFSEYTDAFLKALSSQKDLDALLKLISPDKNDHSKQPALLTFLAHLWMSNIPSSAKVKALQTAAAMCRSIKKATSVIDMQALIPYLIAALADPSRPIRLAASQVCLALKELYDAHSQSSQSSIWAKDVIYGKQSSEVQWLPASDANKFFGESLFPTLEESTVDSTFVIQSMADAINGSETGSKELKSSIRSNAAAFLVSHVVSSPIDTLKLRLLPVISKLGKVAGQARSHILVPHIRDSVAGASGPIGEALIESLSHRSADEVELLKNLASGQLAGESHSQKSAFNRIKKLWPAMKDASRAEMLSWMLDLSLSSSVPDDVQSEAIDSLRGLPLSSDALVYLVEGLPSVSELQGQPSSAKKQRTSRNSDAHKSGSFDKQKLNGAIRRWTLVLELVEESKPERHPQLLRGLFHVLSELHHYKTLLDSELVYLQGLIVNSLLSVVNGLKGSPQSEVDRSVVRPDLIVDCVRTASNTQVQQAALLLMSSLASWAPDLVLHSVMPLFTFMSSTILKQSDDYSAHVTDQTVARIIPPLAASLKKRGRDLISGAAELLLSFTAAYEHIPLHRRKGLFQHLVTTLGSGESLFAIAAMLIERYPEDNTLREFVAELMDHFPARIELLSIRQYLDLIFDTLKPKRGLSDVILGFGEKSTEQAKEATAVLLDGLSDVLNYNGLRRKLAKELKGDDDEAQELRVLYSAILEKTMQLGLQTKPDGDLHDDASNVLTSVLGLMPTKDFIESSAMLMQTGSDEIRQQVFYSLESRVSSAQKANTEMQEVFMDVLPNCGIFIVDSQPVETRVAAIACIDRISEKFGKTDRAKVMQAAEQVVGKSALGSDDDRLRRMSLLCLASMVEVFEDEFVSILPKVMDAALRYMKHQVGFEPDEEGDTLLAAGFSLSMSILDYIPWVLSGTYLDQMLKIAAEAAESGHPGPKQLSDLAARKLSAHDCFAAIERVWEDAVKIGDSSAHYLVKLFHAAIKHHTKATITKESKPIFNILLNAFDLRRRVTPEDDQDKEVDVDIFDDVDTAAMDVVLKLNDSVFRPFFVRFTEWATKGLSKKDKYGTVQRCISLYSFSLALFDQLKSLVTSYAAYLLDNAANLLTTLSSNDESQEQLLETIVQALASNFSHDQDGFWQSPAHFDAIAKPLLGVLEAQDDTLVNDHAIPAIAEFAAAANSPEHHKSLNTILTVYMRHENAANRLAAVKCQRKVTEKLNVDWIGLLPEWLPVISELQEDDDGAVERETLRWIQQIEDVTGESLYNMLQ